MNKNNNTVFPATSWQGKVITTAMRSLVKPVVSRIRFSRRFMKFSQLGFDTVTLALPVHSDVHISPALVGGVPGEWLIAGRGVRSNRVVLYFHGGAYFFGSPRSHRAVTWRMSQYCKAKVLALDYRQPPDWAYPAPIDDAVRAYKALLELGYDPDHIVFAGDSAGGNLSLVTMLRLRELGLPQPSCAVLISPWGDLTCSGDSVATNGDRDPLIPMGALNFVSGSYSREHDPASPLISPVFADYTGLPPILVQVGSTEVLLSDAERVAEQAKRAGVPCQLQVWENMPHVFHALASWIPEAQRALQEIGAFVHDHLSQRDDQGHVRAHARVVRGRE
ncbi:alpha/beta hydrolase [Alcanivorax sp. DP30]|uniref:alpha/beta hydrolase n=1 Tax=Alcanivorax sp. DP30 TaxID=2606217 RepID=UPI00136A696C|nr:alpha/beta hydrolase [Alcanivorax sp. DP30]MZR62011.1 alpha/beta hydrolase fold domain-containing protein [Alcanivorax sp. DP30]